MTTSAQRQADLLAAYKDALARDPAAAPPAGLDPALASTAQRLRQSLRPPEPEPAFVSTLERQLRAAAARMRDGTSAPMARHRWQRQALPSRRWALVLLAALLALALAGTAVASRGLC